MIASRHVASGTFCLESSDMAARDGGIASAEFSHKTGIIEEEILEVGIINYSPNITKSAKSEEARIHEKITSEPTTNLHLLITMRG